VWGAISSNTGLFAGEISHLLCNDIERCRGDPDQALPWHKLSEPRQQVLISMCFNRDVAGVLTFKRMLAAASGADYAGAAEGWRPNGGAKWATGPMSLRA
jgi:hypothetical protein